MLLSWGKYRLWIPYSLTSGIRLFDNRDKLTNATESEAYSLVSGIHIVRDIPTSPDKRVAAVLTNKLGSIDIYSNSWELLNDGWNIQGLGPLISTALEKGIKEVLNNIIPFGLLNISSFIHNLPSFIAFLFVLPLLLSLPFLLQLRTPLLSLTVPNTIIVTIIFISVDIFIERAVWARSPSFSHMWRTNEGT